MKTFRWVLAAILLVVFGVPLAMPVLDLLRRPGAWEAWREGDRLLLLAGNTLRLVAGTLAVAVPLGIVGAVLLYRTDLPGRRFLRFLTVMTLFVPLPLFASGWQAALGSGGWLATAAWSTPSPGDPGVTATGLAWKPWAQGLGAAVWIHAVAGLPWIVLLAGQGLRWVERELEEEALTAAGPWRVLWRVTLPRCRPALGAAALWVALQAAGEITVTDMMQVRTYAEEVYYQLVRPDPDTSGLGMEELAARALAVSLPAVLLTWALIVVAVRGWQRNLPPPATLRSPPLVFPLGRWRWPALVAVLVVSGLLFGVPIGSLVWKAGLAGSPEGWSAIQVRVGVAEAFRVHGKLVVQSLALAGLAGACAAGLALLACWQAVGSRHLQAELATLVALVWALPAPVLGMGLKDTIQFVVVGFDLGAENPMARLLYYGPSPVPVVWAYWVRFFPFAVALLWPVVRLVPPELRDTARLEGARPAQELRRVVWPLAAPACVRAGLAVAVLALGELGASKLLETPGSQTFAHQLFIQMHYSVTNKVAALCLVLLLVVIPGVLLLQVIPGLQRRDER